MKCSVNTIVLVGVLLVVSKNNWAQTFYLGSYQEKMRVKNTRLPQRFFFGPQDVTLLDGRFKGNTVRSGNWLLSIGADKLLHSFRTNAGVYSGNEGGYMTTKKLQGWESLDCELRGHSTGHILSALAFQYAATGNEAFRIKADSIVSGLAVVQDALGQSGYLSAFPEQLINRNIDGQKVWAPWYTLHKILAGLMDQYLYANNQQALVIAVKMGEWAHGKLRNVTDAQRTVMLRNEFGGVNETFFNLYALSGRTEFKWLGDFFYHNEMLDPLLEKTDVLDKKHANTFIPKLLGVLRHHELDSLYEGFSLAAFFWNTVVDHHSFATGSNSDKEKFFKADDQSAHLTGYTGESCNVYNMLKLTNHLYALTGDTRYPAYYEKAMVNHILGQQDTASGMVSYFLPFLPGAHKVYSTPDSSFWCCVGSGFENQAKFGEAIYAHDGSNLFVNLFVASRLNWKEKGMTVEQLTSFPYDGKTTLLVKGAPGTSVSIHIRYPLWATEGSSVKVNGKEVKVKSSRGSYITIRKSWKAGDRIEVDFPYSLRILPAGNDSLKAAIGYGPVILGGALGTEGFEGKQPYSDPLVYNDYYTYNYRVPSHLSASLSIRDGNFLIPVPGQKLVFRTVKEGYLLKPLYDIHRERYVVYWNIIPSTK